MTVKVKICGIKTEAVAIQSVDLGADFIGLNFSPESKRCIDFKEAKKIYNQLQNKHSHSVSLVGLFYKNSSEEITKIINEIPFDFLQFVEHDEFLDLEFLMRTHQNLIPQISVKRNLTDADLSIYNSEYIILDSYKKGSGGGSGNTFEWEFVKSIKRKYFLAGGLNPVNVKNAIEVLNPFGVDVASGVESAPGVKDLKLIEEFIKNAKSI